MMLFLLSIFHMIQVAAASTPQTLIQKTPTELNSLVTPQISDHAPVVFRKEGLAPIISWNILIQQKSKLATSDGPGRTNNGFNDNETEDEYSNRIREIGSIIMEVFLEAPNAIFCLQEGPPDGMELPGVFGKNVSEIIQDNGRGQKLVVLYNPKIYELIQAASPARPVQTVHLRRLADGQIFNIHNMHLPWQTADKQKEAFEQSLATFKVLLSHPGNNVVCGDSNYDVLFPEPTVWQEILTKELPGASVVPGNAVQTWNSSENKPNPPRYMDLILYRKTPIVDDNAATEA